MSLTDFLKNKNVLLTLCNDYADDAVQMVESCQARCLHLPLEIVQAYEETEAKEHLFDQLNDFELIIYGGFRHAQFFVEQINDYKLLKQAQQLLHITLDKKTFVELEKKQIPAIHAAPNGKAIEAVELLIRLKRLGSTIYPCPLNYYDEIPGLLHELGSHCIEYPVFEYAGPDSEKLADYRAVVATQKPDVIIYHAPNAVVKTRAAFPDLDMEKVQHIALNDKTARKLVEERIVPNYMGKGYWEVDSFISSGKE